MSLLRDQARHRPSLCDYGQSALLTPTSPPSQVPSTNRSPDVCAGVGPADPFQLFALAIPPPFLPFAVSLSAVAIVRPVVGSAVPAGPPALIALGRAGFAA